MNLPPLPDRRTLLTAGAAAALTGVTATACSAASGSGSATGDGDNSSGTSGTTGGTTPASPASSVPSKPSPPARRTGPPWPRASTASSYAPRTRPTRPPVSSTTPASTVRSPLRSPTSSTRRTFASAWPSPAAPPPPCPSAAAVIPTCGWSSGNGRLVLDVSSLSRVDRNGTIGAGAKLTDVYRGLARHGLTIPGGSCPTVGISGLTLGGGHGVASRAYGLTCDSLTAATVVTADGKTLTVDAKHHPDLFWALRGAGNGNFGVVTELTFRTRPAPQTVTAYMSWPWSRARAVVQAWQEWGPSQPDEIWSSAHLDAGPGGGHPTVSVAAFSLGTYGDLQNAVDRLADRIGASASSVSLRRRSYQESMLVYAGCSGITDAQCHLPGTTPGRTPQGTLQRETYAAASDFYDRSLSPAGVSALLDRAEAFTRIPVTRSGGGGSIMLTALGGAINRVSPQATAFVHRRSRVLAQYIGSWRPGTAGSAQQDWLKITHAAMRRYASGAAYQNYTDPTLTDWRRAYYGSAADRLTRLKKQYDPGRLFAFPQAL